MLQRMDGEVIILGYFVILISLLYGFDLFFFNTKMNY